MNEMITQLFTILALLETGSSAVHVNGDAVGKYQIRPIFVRDVNRIAHTLYNHEDAWEERKAQHMIFVYLIHYGGKMAQRTGRFPTVYDLAMMFHKGPFGYTERGCDYGIRAVNLYNEMKGE